MHTQPHWWRRPHPRTASSCSAPVPHHTTDIMSHYQRNEMKWNEKCSDLKCAQKPTQSRLSLTHHANKSSRWADKNIKWSESPWNQSGRKGRYKDTTAIIEPHNAEWFMPPYTSLKSAIFHTGVFNYHAQSLFSYNAHCLSSVPGQCLDLPQTN